MNTNQYIHALANPFDCDYYGKEFSQNQNITYHRNGESFSDQRHSQAMNMNSLQFVPFEANSNPCGVYGFNLPQNQDKEHRFDHSNILPLDDQKNSQAIKMVTEPCMSGESNYSCSDVSGINLTQQQRIQEHNMVRDGILASASYSCDNEQARKKKRVRERNFVCEVCGREFFEMSSLTVHSRTHSGDRPFPCEVCEKKFASKEGLRSHLVSHSDERRFKCDLCDKKYTTKQSMQHHRVMHTGEKPHACEVCQKAFSIRKSLSRHMMTHSEERPFSCDQCDKKFKTKKDLRVHGSVHTKEKPFLCDLCSDWFYNPQHLKKHQQQVHFGVKPYHCEICSKQYANKEYFLKHVQSHDQQRDAQTLDIHPSTTPVEKNPKNILQGPKMNRRQPHTCLTCRKEFADACELEKHRLYHKREKPFACVICQVRFHRSRNLKLHLSIIHAVESSKPKRHRKIPRGQGAIACDQCGKKLMRHSNLRYHVRRYHSLTDSLKDRPFQCSVCSQRFLEKSHLKTHSYCHGGLRKSQIADMSSEQHASDDENAVDDPREKVSQKSQRYQKHRKRPANVSCDECGQKFTREANLRYHVRRYHPLTDPLKDRPHKCSVCSLRFRRFGHLKRHSLYHGELSNL